MGTKENLEFALNILTTLDNHENSIYKDFFTMMAFKPYVTFITGKRDDGTKAFIFELNSNGIEVVKEMQGELELLQF